MFVFEMHNCLKKVSLSFWVISVRMSGLHFPLRSKIVSECIIVIFPCSSFILPKKYGEFIMVNCIRSSERFFGLGWGQPPQPPNNEWITPIETVLMIKLFFWRGMPRCIFEFPLKSSPSHQKQQRKTLSSPLKTILFECPLVNSVNKRSQQFAT